MINLMLVYVIHWQSRLVLYVWNTTTSKSQLNKRISYASHINRIPLYVQSTSFALRVIAEKNMVHISSVESEWRIRTSVNYHWYGI